MNLSLNKGWRCTLFGGTFENGISFYPARPPNWFQRLMSKWFFGCTWTYVE